MSKHKVAHFLRQGTILQNIIRYDSQLETKKDWPYNIQNFNTL